MTSDSKVLGFAVMLQWLSLNRYMTYSEKYSHLPNTFVGSTFAVTSGIIGVLPVVIGFSCLTTSFLYMSFHYRDVSTTMFTYFYSINGDTLFDTLYPASKIAGFITFIWTWFFLMFGIFNILKIAIAMTEEGYIQNK